MSVVCPWYERTFVMGKPRKRNEDIKRKEKKNGSLNSNLRLLCIHHLHFVPLVLFARPSHFMSVLPGLITKKYCFLDLSCDFSRLHGARLPFKDKTNMSFEQESSLSPQAEWMRRWALTSFHHSSWMRGTSAQIPEKLAIFLTRKFVTLWIWSCLFSTSIISDKSGWFRIYVENEARHCSLVLIYRPIKQCNWK